MKKFITLLAFSLFFFITNPVFASDLTKSDFERFQRMGFTDSDIADLTEKDLEYFKDIDGELIEFTETHYEVITDSDGEILEFIELEEYFEEKVEIEEQMNNEDSVIRLPNNKLLSTYSTKAWSSTKESSFIKLRAFVNKINTDDYQFRLHLEWKSVPKNRFFDAAAITHSSDWNILGNFNVRNSVDI